MCISEVWTRVLKILDGSWAILQKLGMRATESGRPKLGRRLRMHGGIPVQDRADGQEVVDGNEHATKNLRSSTFEVSNSEMS